MVSPPPSTEDEDDDAFGSPTEKCGFVCHLITLLLALVYTVYWCSFLVGSDEEGSNNTPVWLSTLPATAVCLFYAAPLLYGVLNTTLVASPTQFACLEDSHTRRCAPTEQPAAAATDDDNGGILEIHDIDVGVVNDSVWEAMQSQKTGD